MTADGDEAVDNRLHRLAVPHAVGMREPPGVAALQYGVFTAYQAMADGWTPEALEHAAHTGQIRRERRGVYAVPSDVSDPYERARELHLTSAVAAALATPGTRIAGCAAAVLYDLPVLRLPRKACVAAEPWLTNSVPGVHLHRCPARRSRRSGLLVDTVERTVVDIAREHGALAGLITLDAALHAGRTDPSSVAAEVEAARRWPGVRRAREMTTLTDPRCESPLETCSRFAFLRCGLDTPSTQVAIGNDRGGFVARVDFYWDEFGTVGEADGAGKYTDLGTLRAEKRRQEALEQLGLRVVRWTGSELQRPDDVANRLRQAFARGAGPDSDQRRWTVLPSRDGLHIATSPS